MKGPVTVGVDAGYKSDVFAVSAPPRQAGKSQFNWEVLRESLEDEKVNFDSSDHRKYFPDFECVIAGVHYRPPYERSILAKVTGDYLMVMGPVRLYLDREAFNVNDKNAVKVLLPYDPVTLQPCENEMSNNTPAHIGYLPKEFARIVAPYMDANGNRCVKAHIVRLVGKDYLIRVSAT